MRMLIFFAVLFISKFHAQTFRSAHTGISMGVQISFGSHVNSLGLNWNVYYTNFFFQCNAGSSLRFNFTSYGERINYFENRNNLGLLILAGPKETTPNFQLDGLLHNTSYNFGLGYNYIWYVDNSRTSQLSGGWGLHIKKFSILFENDVFGGQSKDRFRTGQLALNYRPTENIILSSGIYMWTGETAHSIWQKIPMEKCPSGFRFLEDLPFGRTSHGIVYGGIQYALPYGQVAGCRVGADSEHYRHFVQNRLSHDLILLPKRIKRNTPHYPRLDDFGCPTFERERVRKDKFYFNVNLNEHWSN